ncbi:MAG: hypothetical protein ACO1OB_20095 [Archangium sp.]
MKAQGARLFFFPRAVSFGNWPFLVFLVFLASVLSYLPARAGEWHIVAAFFGAIALAPGLIGVAYYALEPYGSLLLEDHPGCVEGASVIEDKLASLKRRY